VKSPLLCINRKKTQFLTRTAVCLNRQKPVFLTPLLKKMSQTSSDLQKKYETLRDQLPKNVQLVAVSKTHSAEKIQEVYQLGQRVFGENKVQEMTEKATVLPDDIRWHLIGHLQRNKVKYIAPFVHMIESVDSEKLLAEISKEAQKCGRTINVLLQVKIAQEDQKYGLEINETKELLMQHAQGHFPGTQIKGLMGMATFTQHRQQIEAEFTMLKHLYDQLSARYQLTTLSMGMSGDFQLAISCGSNSVRIGSLIFGSRA